MAFLQAIQGGGGAPPGGSPMGPNPASQGMGDPPSLPGLPPPPTGEGAMPIGNTGSTKKAAGDEAIEALRTFQGFVPAMMGDINAMIDKIKAQTKAEGKPGPAVGEPGPPGAASVDATPLMESGGPGAN